MNEIMDVINLIGEKKLSLGEEIKIIEELKSYQKIAKKKGKKKQYCHIDKPVIW